MTFDPHQSKTQALKEIASAETLQALEAIRLHYLGRKGRIAEQIKELAQLPLQERKTSGRQLNQLKKELEDRP